MSERVDARDDYRAVCRRRDELRAEWADAGSPTTTLGGSTGRAVVVHPLLEALQAEERHVERLRARLPRDIGRPSMQGGVMSTAEFRAAVEAGIGPPPSRKPASLEGSP